MVLEKIVLWPKVRYYYKVPVGTQIISDIDKESVSRHNRRWSKIIIERWQWWLWQYSF